MSPSWRDRLLIGLAPDRVAVIELKRGLHPALGIHGVRGCPEVAGTPWVAAVSRLDEMLVKLPPKGGVASVVLSNQFVRYVTVPWTPGIYSDEDRLALATDCFRAIHGEIAGSWRVVLDGARFGQGNLAAAIDGPLVEALRDVLERHRWRLGSLRPHLAAAFDRWRASLEPSDGCFVVVEPGCVTALFRRGDAWAGVDSRRFRRRSTGQATLTLKQCIDSDRLQGGEGAVALLAPGAVPEAQGTADRPVRRLAGLAGPWPEDPWRALAWSAA